MAIILSLELTSHVYHFSHASTFQLYVMSFMFSTRVSFWSNLSLMLILHELRIFLLYIISLLINLLRCVHRVGLAYFAVIELFMRLSYSVAIIFTLPFIYRYHPP